MKRTFIYDDSLQGIFRKNGVGDKDLRLLENDIMRGGGDLMVGTAGLRKIRCGSAGRGKSGSVRVIFADYPRVARTYLLTAFGKSEKDNLSQSERSELALFKKQLDRVIEGMV